MTEKKEVALHYVCTLDEARKLTEGIDKFWVLNCGCREHYGDNCERSRKDVCLVFYDAPVTWGSNLREISKDEMKEIFKEALTAEKDSIVFYLGMKELVPEKLGKSTIDKIIKEEMDHIKLLGHKLSALKD